MSALPGFRFRPSAYTPSLGHAGLDMELSDRPRQSQSFLRQATFRIISSRLVDHTFYDLRSENGRTRTVRVVLGAFHLLAGNYDLIYGFSFGGSLKQEDCGEYTSLLFESDAPLFEMVEEYDSTPIFVFSVLQGQIARCRATWLKDDIGYERRLVALDPFELFVASLATLDDYLPQFARWGDDYRAGLRWVRRAIQTLVRAEQWPHTVKFLENLLARPA